MSKNPHLDQWKGFLPQGAWIMARTSEQASSLPQNSLKESLPQTSSPDLSLLLNPEASPILPSRASGEVLQISNPIALQEIETLLKDCSRCQLSCTRKNLVFGEGNPQARLVFVGEGPGEEEDLEGRPFVGKAGQLLDRMINAIGLSRSEVYILNVVKCRPPGNRNPEADEVAACAPFLHQQLQAIQPEVIVALGKFAAQTLLKTEEKITQLRGRFHSYSGAKLMPTFHPAYLLRNPASKKEAWWDLQEVAKALNLQIPQRKT